MTFEARGSKLLIEKPFTYALKSDLRSDICDSCFLRVPVKKCSGCQTLYYCNRECQKKGWKIHKKECPLLLKIKPQVLPDAAFLLARIILRLKKKDDKKSYYSQSEFRTFNDLMSHEENILVDELRMNHLSLLALILNQYLGEHELPEFGELVRMYGKMCINGFTIMNSDMQGIGTGIYLAGSSIDHSCEPNAVAVFKGTILHIVAIEDIHDFSWSKVHISYEDLLSSTSKRKKELQRCYYFDCTCLRCVDCEKQKLESSMVCPDTKCSSPVFIQGTAANNVSCEFCKQKIAEENVIKFKKLLKNAQEKIEDLDTNLTDLTRLSQELSKFAHPHNFYYSKVLDFTCEAAINEELWEEAAYFGSRLIEGFRNYYGDFHPVTGFHFMKLSKIYNILEEENLSKKYFKEALKILNVIGCEFFPTFNFNEHQ